MQQITIGSQDLTANERLTFIESYLAAAKHQMQVDPNSTDLATKHQSLIEYRATNAKALLISAIAHLDALGADEMSVEWLTK